MPLYFRIVHSNYKHTTHTYAVSAYASFGQLKSKFHHGRHWQHDIAYSKRQFQVSFLLWETDAGGLKSAWCVCRQAGRQAGRQAHRRNGVMYIGTSIQTHIYMYMMHTALTCMHTDTTSRYPPEHLELVKAMSSIAMSPYGPLPRTPSNTTCR